jgi:transglutaminase-like putative cysteine protease
MKHIKNALTVLIAGTLLWSVVSCFNPAGTAGPGGDMPAVEGSFGQVRARIFLPDYNKLAAAGNRAIAPQTAKVRLSLGSGDPVTWTPHGNAIDIDWDDVDDIPGAPSDLPGGIWTARFEDLESGTYGAGKLKIDLLDASNNVITSGLNEEPVIITHDGTTPAAFFTTPVNSGAQTDSLAQGEMRFWKISMTGGYLYNFTVTATGTYPDIVVFNMDGTFRSYHAVTGMAGDDQFELSPELNPRENASYYIGVWADAGEVNPYSLDIQESGYSSISEDFETGDFSAYDWARSGAAIKTAALEQPGNAYFGNSGKFVKLDGGFNANSFLEIQGLNPAVDSALTFKYKNELWGGDTSGQTFTLYLDGTPVKTWTNLATGTSRWLSHTILVLAGSHSVKFEVKTAAGGYIGGGDILNAVYLDDISLVPDTTESVVISPRGSQDTWVGGLDIQYSARALRSDGSVREGVAFTFSSTGGGVDSATGSFSPTAAGTYTVTASADGKSATSGTLTVHGSDYLRQPYTYPGTGITYNGYTAGTTVSATTQGGVTVTYPAANGASFSADGFFTLEGTVNNSGVYNYAYVEVTKGALETSYFVQGAFKTRIWLRFGPGDYTVKIHGLDDIITGLGAEGDITNWLKFNNPITYTVTNTRNEGTAPSGNADWRFLYPSSINQSDSFLVTNLASDLTYGITNPAAKARAVHDYLITNTVYDVESLTASLRKKQDALTVLGKRYFIDTQYNPGGHYLAVCEGYANASAALMRAAGLEVRYRASEPLNHGWDHVYVDGGWKLYDATWDDPVKSSSSTGDYGPGYIRYANFLLANLSGGSNAHTGDTTEDGRFAVPDIRPPRQPGVPDGWY